MLSNHEQKEDAYLKLVFCVTIFPSGLELGGSGISEDVERMMHSTEARWYYTVKHYKTDFFVCVMKMVSAGDPGVSKRHHQAALRSRLGWAVLMLPDLFYPR